MKFIKETLAGMSLLLLSASANAGIIRAIDDFSVSQSRIEAMLGQTVAGFALGSDIIGGERDLIVRNFDSFTANRMASAEVQDGLFNFSADSTVIAEFELQYDGIDGSANINTAGFMDPVTGRGVDIIALGVREWVTTVLFADFNYWFDVTFWWDQGTQSETKSFLGPGNNNPHAPYQAVLPLTQFSSTDFTDLTAIRIRGNVLSPDQVRVSSFDVTLDSIVAVPEPSAIMLFGLALLGIGLARRRFS